jgi:hypothetical protein
MVGRRKSPCISGSGGGGAGGGVVAAVVVVVVQACVRLVQIGLRSASSCPGVDAMYELDWRWVKLGLSKRLDLNSNWNPTALDIWSERRASDSSIFSIT